MYDRFLQQIAHLRALVFFIVIGRLILILMFKYNRHDTPIRAGLSAVLWIVVPCMIAAYNINASIDDVHLVYSKEMLGSTANNIASMGWFGIMMFIGHVWFYIVIWEQIPDDVKPIPYDKLNVMYTLFFLPYLLLSIAAVLYIEFNWQI